MRRPTEESRGWNIQQHARDSLEERLALGFHVFVYLLFENVVRLHDLSGIVHLQVLQFLVSEETID